ncbi:MAG: hypothetical protein KAS67_03925, partial [Thermoplasmata archaeon]|nr:hypothetical protein [Thermoplasmata archaeon]
LNITITESHTGIQYPSVKGMALYLPDGQVYDTRYDTELLFAGTDWDEFVNCFRAPVQTPLIEHTGSDVYENSSAIRVNATITDDDLDSDEVYINYRFDGGAWTKAAMKGSGSRFHYDIPGTGNVMEYYISATDMTGNTMSLPYGVTRGSTDYFTHTSENSMSIHLNSIIHSPSTNVTEGDNVTFTILAENQGTAAGQDINISLSIGVGDNASLIDYALVDIQSGQNGNVSFIWEAIAGNHTVQASVSWGNQVLDTMSLDILVDNSTTGNTALQNEVEKELNELWFGVILMVLGASAISFTALLAGRRVVKGRKKTLAYKAVDNAAYYVNSFADFGADISLASWKLEKAREAIGEKRYDAAYKLALEAKESIDTFDMGGKADGGGGQYHR